jgi:predicted kinase/SHS2 domain-containing protein
LCGVPGSGKSFLARRVQPQLPATIVETDHVRRLLFARPRYTGSESAWVYAVCHALIARLLQRGQSVIFDATNLAEQQRKRLRRLAEAGCARFVLVHTIAPDAIIRQRLTARLAAADPSNYSEADIAVYEKLRLTEQPIRCEHLAIDTTQDVTQAVARVLSCCRGDVADRSYMLLDHTADLALRVWGRCLEDLFTNAAAGMFAQMMDAPAPCDVQRTVVVEGEDAETLLVGWLSELLYLREVYREAYRQFEVSFPVAGRLEGSARGGQYRAFDRPIKAVTYHGLQIEHTADGYAATIVFDV